MIELINLKKSFGNKEVLKGVNLKIADGKTTTIIGSSGCGKSVLLKHIVGLLKPDDGHVIVDGEDVSKMNEKELYKMRNNIGFLFQSAALFDSMTVGENVGVGLKENTDTPDEEIDRIVSEKLELVDLKGTENLMPSELSGGQRKRIGIARTLIMKPEIMLYDEPTSGLDPMTCIEINNLIVKVQQQYNASAIIITHDLTCAKTTANKVTMIIDGKFLAPGDFDEIFNATNTNTKAFFDYNFINSK